MEQRYCFKAKVFSTVQEKWNIFPEGSLFLCSGRLSRYGVKRLASHTISGRRVIVYRCKNVCEATVKNFIFYLWANLIDSV